MFIIDYDVRTGSFVGIVVLCLWFCVHVRISCLFGVSREYNSIYNGICIATVGTSTGRLLVSCGLGEYN